MSIGLRAKTLTAKSMKQSNKKVVKVKIKKPPTITALKKKADTLFSLYIRQKYADKDGMVKCYTCATVRHWKQMQNGHFVTRKYLGTRYDERNCRPQCFYCNFQKFGNGRPVEFAEGLVKEYGENIVSELFAKARLLTTFFNYQEVIDTFTVKV